MTDARSNIIKGRAAMNGIDVNRISKKTGIPASTLYKRLRSPGRITLDEFEAIDRVVHFTDEEVLMLVKGRRRW